MDIEWLVLCDAAQVVGGKLYVMGGGWDQLTVNTGFPLDQHMAIAVAVKVPWNETNQKHNLEIAIQHEDGLQLAKIDAQFEVGRPPGLTAGQDQRVQLAVDLRLKIERSGAYGIIARLEDEEMERTTFRVLPAPGLRPA